jgi:4,5:9,10-diseco-3-hydroxy-5,9,17-trioxoandrosta-1(10),2-diene-4-oate hydrolase
MMTTPQDRYINVGQFRSRYWAAGDKGSHIILIHGIGQYVEHWASAISALAAHHQVYAVDLPGHGKTDKPMDISYTIDDFSQFVKDFMSTLGIEKAHIIGHSLGGIVSVRLVLRETAAVDKLVLVNSAGFGRELGMLFRILRLPILGDMISRPSLSGSSTLLKRCVYNPATMTEDIIEQNYQLYSLPGAQQAFIKTLRTNVDLLGRQIVNSHDLQCITSITNPVLVIWGQQDNQIPVTHAEIAAKRFPNVCVQIITNCGHFPMLEHASEFNTLLLDFLKD